MLTTSVSPEDTVLGETSGSQEDPYCTVLRYEVLRAVESTDSESTVAPRGLKGRAEWASVVNGAETQSGKMRKLWRCWRCRLRHSTSVPNATEPDTQNG